MIFWFETSPRLKNKRFYFPALEFVASLRWLDGVTVCPHCEGKNCGFLKTRRIWKCRTCRTQFSVKTGTIFEESPIALDKWLMAIWLVVNCKNGISSYEIARDLKVTQKSAWFMLHRVRLASRMACVTLQNEILNTIEHKATVYTDGWAGSPAWFHL